MLISPLSFQLEKRKEVLRNQFIPMKIQPKKAIPEEDEESMVSYTITITIVLLGESAVFLNSVFSQVSRVLYEREAAKDLDEDEAIFNIEEELAKTVGIR